MIWINRQKLTISNGDQFVVVVLIRKRPGHLKPIYGSSYFSLWFRFLAQSQVWRAPFVWRGPMVPPWLRFHIPLIEPDRQISRIRLSDKTSRLNFRVQRHLQFLNTHRSW